MEMEGLESMTLEQLLAPYKKTRIKSLNQELDYLEARKVAEPYGGLPRNVTHKRMLVDSDDWQTPELKEYHIAWAREMLVYPKSNEVFLPGGQDAVDSCEDKKGRAWVYPAFCIPDIALNKRNVALFVTPRYIEETDKQVTVIADPRKDVVVLYDFPQCSQWGTVDEKTGIPLSAKNVDTSSSSAGYLRRPDIAGVRPLVRYYNDYSAHSNRRDVDSYIGYSNRFGVGVESLEVVPQNLESLTLGQLLSAVKKE